MESQVTQMIKKKERTRVIRAKRLNIMTTIKVMIRLINGFIRLSKEKTVIMLFKSDTLKQIKLMMTA